MNDRPKLKLKLNLLDISLEVLGWLTLIAIWVYTVLHYTDLPDIVPTHYNASGDADDFGGKGHILALPIVSSVLFIGLSILNNYPHLFNYPTELTQENALKQYTMATRLIRFLKFSISIIFGLIVLKTVQNALGQSEGLGVWFLPSALSLIFIPLIYYIVQQIREK